MTPVLASVCLLNSRTLDRWLIDWLIDWSIDWLIDWLIVIDWLIDFLLVFHYKAAASQGASACNATPLHLSSCLYEAATLWLVLCAVFNGLATVVAACVSPSTFFRQRSSDSIDIYLLCHRPEVWTLLCDGCSVGLNQCTLLKQTCHGQGLAWKLAFAVYTSKRPGRMMTCQALFEVSLASSYKVSGHLGSLPDVAPPHHGCRNPQC